MDDGNNVTSLDESGITADTTATSPAAAVTIFSRTLDLSAVPPTHHSRVPAVVAEPTVAVHTPSSAEHVSHVDAVAVTDVCDDEHAVRTVSPLAAVDVRKPGATIELQTIAIESPSEKRRTAVGAASKELEATPLNKPHPNWDSPNVDLSRGLSVPFPSSTAEPHVVPSTLPWLQRWVDKRWRFLFPAYRRLDVWGLRGFSICELVFIAIYSLVNAILIIVGIIQLATANKYDGDEGDLYNIGQNFGTYGTINVLLLLLPNTRSNVWQYVFGMSFERSVWYHKWIARVAVAELAIHGAAVYADSYYNNSLWADASNGGVTGEYGSGSIAFFIAVAIVVLSLYPFRRYLHESFLRVHMVLFIAFIVFGFIHDGTVALIAPALILYVVDWVLRIRMWRQPVRVLDVQLLPGGVTRITFQKDNFTYQSGQYIFICIPAVSPWEWHPYSLSSSPHHPVLTVHCKTIGRWTRRLAELARRGKEEGRDWTKLKMHTEGPYGQLSVPLAQYSSVLLVCGGIGVTPLGSIYNSLVHDHYRGVRRLRQLKLVWSLREPALITSLYDDVRKAEAVEPEERADAAGESPSYFFHPRALAQRDALVNAASMTPTTAASMSAVQPLAGRVRNAFHLTKLKAEHQEQLRGVQSYYGEWIKEGRPELAVAFSEMRQAMTDERVSLVTMSEAASAGAVGAAEPIVSRCAVLACGPSVLIDDVRAFCIRQSTPLVHFDLHEETFSW